VSAGVSVVVSMIVVLVFFDIITSSIFDA
jgi:hypothetical protein